MSSRYTLDYRDHKGHSEYCRVVTVGSTSSSMAQFNLDIMKILRRLTAGLNIVDDSVTTGYCRFCKAKVGHPREDFCSQDCVISYWEHVRQKRGNASGNWLCSMPGCDKKCWVKDNGGVHDYCSKSHAEEHQRIKSSLKPMKKKSSNGSPGSVSSTYPTASGSHSTTRQHSSGPIYFYDKSSPYYEFTNFYDAPIVLDDKQWPTTEHYFQAQKFVGTPYLEVVRRCSSPREALEISRRPSVSTWCRKDWEEVKIDVMKKALLAKFSQHDNLRKKLVETGSRTLVERSPYDSFWGDGGDGSGKNWLGRLLMEIRNNYVKVK